MKNSMIAARLIKLNNELINVVKFYKLKNITVENKNLESKLNSFGDNKKSVCTCCLYYNWSVESFRKDSSCSRCRKNQHDRDNLLELIKSKYSEEETVLVDKNNCAKETEELRNSRDDLLAQVESLQVPQ